MTFPEDRPGPAAAHPSRPPNYLLGLALNLLLPGSGFTYINQWPWHLGWLVILLGLSILLPLLGFGLSLAGNGSGFGALLFVPVLAWLAHLIHYHVSYRRAAARGFRPALNDGAKVALIVGHFVVGFFLTGTLSAVLIPNLLGARTKAAQAAEQAAARMMYTQIMADQAQGLPLKETCPVLETSLAGAEVTTCRVGLADPQNPTLDLTFSSGRSVHLP